MAHFTPAYFTFLRELKRHNDHRDTRFSPDKSPFRTWTAARFPHEARRKVKSVPSFYVHLGPGESFGGGGVYHVETAALTAIRRRIAESPDDWTAVRQSGIEIHGEQLKRVPAGFPSAHPHPDDLKRQNLYTLTAFTEADVVAGDFLDRFTASCEQAERSGAEGPPGIKRRR